MIKSYQFKYKAIKKSGVVVSICPYCENSRAAEVEGRTSNFIIDYVPCTIHYNEQLSKRLGTN